MIVVKHMSSATFFKKNGLLERKDLLDRISIYRRTSSSAEDARKSKTAVFLAEDIVSAKWNADRRLQTELGEKAERGRRT